MVPLPQPPQRLCSLTNPKIERSASCGERAVRGLREAGGPEDVLDVVGQLKLVLLLASQEVDSGQPLGRAVLDRVEGDELPWRVLGVVRVEGEPMNEHRSGEAEVIVERDWMSIELEQHDSGPAALTKSSDGVPIARRGSPSCAKWLVVSNASGCCRSSARRCRLTPLFADCQQFIWGRERLDEERSLVTTW